MLFSPLKVRIKRPWLGNASVRSYLVEKGIKERRDIIIEMESKTMTIPWKDLSKGIVNKETFHSRFGKSQYHLVDFKWQPDKNPNLSLF